MLFNQTDILQSGHFVCLTFKHESNRWKKSNHHKAKSFQIIHEIITKSMLVRQGHNCSLCQGLNWRPHTCLTSNRTPGGQRLGLWSGGPQRWGALEKSAPCFVWCSFLVHGFKFPSSLLWGSYLEPLLIVRSFFFFFFFEISIPLKCTSSWFHFAVSELMRNSIALVLLRMKMTPRQQSRAQLTRLELPGLSPDELGNREMDLPDLKLRQVWMHDWPVSSRVNIPTWPFARQLFWGETSHHQRDSVRSLDGKVDWQIAWHWKLITGCKFESFSEGSRRTRRASYNWTPGYEVHAAGAVLDLNALWNAWKSVEALGW